MWNFLTINAIKRGIVRVAEKVTPKRLITNGVQVNVLNTAQNHRTFSGYTIGPLPLLIF
jgi:hypothetical protein